MLRLSADGQSVLRASPWKNGVCHLKFPVQNSDALPISATGVGCLLALTGELQQQSRGSKVLSACLAVIRKVSVPAEIPGNFLSLELTLGQICEKESELCWYTYPMYLSFLSLSDFAHMGYFFFAKIQA